MDIHSSETSVQEQATFAITDKLTVKEELKTFTKIGAPILVTQLLQMSMGITDSVMVGQFSAVHLAGVSLGSGTWFTFAIGIAGILFILPAFISNHMGAKNEHLVPPLVRSALWLSLLLGSSLFAIAYFVLPPLYTAFEVIEPTKVIAVQYITILSFSAPFFAMGAALRSYSEGLGKTFVISVIMVFSVLLNVVLNWVFIYGNLGMPQLGGAGAAIASAGVNVFGFFMILALTILRPEYKTTKFFDKFSWPDLQLIRQILVKGVPIGFTLFIEISMFGGVAILASRLPSEVTAGHFIALQVASLAFMVPLAIALTTTIRTSFHLGEGSKRNVMQVARLAFTMALSFSFVNAAILYFLGKEISTLFTDDKTAIYFGAVLLIYAAVFQFADAFQAIAYGLLRAFQDTFIPALFSGFSYWMVGIPIGYLLMFYSFPVTDYFLEAGYFAAQENADGLGIYGLWIGMVISLTVVSLLLILRLIYVFERFKQGNWKLQTDHS